MVKSVQFNPIKDVRCIAISYGLAVFFKKFGQMYSFEQSFTSVAHWLNSPDAIFELGSIY
jgi:hypothetical protein